MALLGTALSALAALAGVMIGGHLSTRRELLQWSRDRRYDSYRAVASAARAMLFRGDEVATERSDGTISEQQERVRSAMFDLREAALDVELVGSDKVVEAVQSLRTLFGDDLYDYFMSLAVPAEPEHPAVKQAQRSLRTFQEVARRDLAN